MRPPCAAERCGAEPAQRAALLLASCLPSRCLLNSPRARSPCSLQISDARKKEQRLMFWNCFIKVINISMVFGVPTMVLTAVLVSRRCLLRLCCCLLCATASAVPQNVVYTSGMQLIRIQLHYTFMRI